MFIMHPDCAKRYAETHPTVEISDSCCLCGDPFQVEAVEDEGTVRIGSGGVARIEWE
jgi:hypothetical protein